MSSEWDRSGDDGRRQRPARLVVWAELGRRAAVGRRVRPRHDQREVVHRRLQGREVRLRARGGLLGPELADVARFREAAAPAAVRPPRLVRASSSRPGPRRPSRRRASIVLWRLRCRPSQRPAVRPARAAHLHGRTERADDACEDDAYRDAELIRNVLSSVGVWLPICALAALRTSSRLLVMRRLSLQREARACRF